LCGENRKEEKGKTAAKEKKKEKSRFRNQEPSEWSEIIKQLLYHA